MKVVVDRIVQYPNRFQLVNVSTSEVLGVFDLSAVTGTIQQVGTEINAELFQSIQDDLTQLAQNIVEERNARGVDVNALQNSIATKITANGGELGNAVVTFSEVSNASNIASGEKASILFGKIRNWFSRLKALAFKDTIADADISSNANISQSKVSGLTAIQNKLNGIDAGANNYTLPVSTATNLGGVKVGSRLSVATDGTLSADSQTENSYTTTEKNKLAGIESGAQKNVVTSVAGKTGAVTLDKSNVGLSNVANERQYSASNPPPYPVTSVNGSTGEVRVAVPTKTSELTNDSGFLTGIPLANSYTIGGVKISATGLDMGNGLYLKDGYLLSRHGIYGYKAMISYPFQANRLYYLSDVIYDLGLKERDLNGALIDVFCPNESGLLWAENDISLAFGGLNTAYNYSISNRFTGEVTSTIGANNPATSPILWKYSADNGIVRSSFPIRLYADRYIEDGRGFFRVSTEQNYTEWSKQVIITGPSASSQYAFVSNVDIPTNIPLYLVFYTKFGYNY